MFDAGKVQFWSCLSFSSMNPDQFCADLINVCQAKGMVCFLFVLFHLISLVCFPKILTSFLNCLEFVPAFQSRSFGAYSPSQFKSNWKRACGT